MKQYEELKLRYGSEILLFRLGDFYEIFGEDAKQAAPVLEVVLTQRQGVPMCGVPYHAVSRYISKLLKKNFRVALAEQLEDPSQAKGIVRRDVTRVISPGTILEENLLESGSNNFLIAVSTSNSVETGSVQVGLAALDFSTGEFFNTEFEDDLNFHTLAGEISRINPSEVLSTEPKVQSLLPESLPSQTLRPDDFRDHDRSMSEIAIRMITEYVQKMNPGQSIRLNEPRRIESSETMAFDRETLDNLEVVRNSIDGTTRSTLLEFLDQTESAMGGRLLKQWLVRPLTHLDKILERLISVEFFVKNSNLRNAAREKLKGAMDLERILVRVMASQAGPRDLLGLKNTLVRSQSLKNVLTKAESRKPKLLESFCSSLGEFSTLLNVLENAISSEPPIRLEDAGVIRDGYNKDLDEKRSASRDGKVWLAELEEREREATDIPTLKAGYTSVFGYYFEVTKPHLSKVPAGWHRKQTLTNAERYINEDLKKLEQKILGAEEQALRIEKELCRQILERIRQDAPGIEQSARAVAALDCLLSLAEVADRKGLTQPEIDNAQVLEIRDGWHPVVHDSLPAGGFVPNDCSMNSSTDQIIILTGPNMSGKSTYLRQTALTVLMAHIGSFVPAKSAIIGLTDRIFTRIGSGDRLAQGQSTFMVEMKETAQILKNATTKSLVILDEVGRGTSTYDGISIAWSVIEYLQKHQKPKVLFATHYFELTHLASTMKGVKNYNVMAKEWKDSVVFLHKIAPGPADRSFGIHVAKLAGLPEPVVDRARSILKDLEKEHESLIKSRKHIQQELTL